MQDDRLSKIVAQLLLLRPDLTESSIMSYITEKKNKVGAGFLTDVGAAYLVAGDFGINLSEVEQKTYGLKNVQPGLNGITIKANLLSISPLKSYTRNDGTKGSYRRLLLFEDKSIVRAVQWEADAQPNISFPTGQQITITNASTRLNREGKMEIHINSKSDIAADESRPPQDATATSIPPSNVMSPGGPLVVKGAVLSPPREITFNKKDGSQGRALQFYLGDDLKSPTQIRVVIWSFTDAARPLITEGSFLQLIDVEARSGREQRLELHGTEATQVLQLSEPPAGVPENASFLVISVGPEVNENGRRTALLYEGTRAVTWTASGKQAFVLGTLSPGDQLEIKNYTLIGGQLIVPNPAHDVTIMKNGSPELNNLHTSINDALNASDGIIVEAVALAKSNKKQISLKDGRTSMLTELLIGDATGQAELTAWGDLGDQLASILPGNRLILYGVVAKRTPQNQTRLEAKEYSQIQRVTD